MVGAGEWAGRVVGHQAEVHPVGGRRTDAPMQSTHPDDDRDRSPACSER